MDQGGHLRCDGHICATGTRTGAGAGALQADAAVYDHNRDVLFADREDVSGALADRAGGFEIRASGGDGADVFRGVGSFADDGAGGAAGAGARVVRAMAARDAGAVRVRVDAGSAPTGRGAAKTAGGARLAGPLPPRDTAGARDARGRVRGVSGPHALGPSDPVRALLSRGLPPPLPRHDGPVPDLRATLRLLLNAGESYRL